MTTKTAQQSVEMILVRQLASYLFVPVLVRTPRQVALAAPTPVPSWVDAPNVPTRRVRRRSTSTPDRASD
jgi:hypothetical protein